MNATVMETALTSLIDVVESVLTLISGNAVLMVFLVAGLLGIAISAVKKLVGRY